MRQATSTHKEFERIAREYFAQHPAIPSMWRETRGSSGGKADLVFWPGISLEVFASLTESNITVGGGNLAEEFEPFGRGVSNKELAGEALALYESIVRKRGGEDA